MSHKLLLLLALCLPVLSSAAVDGEVVEWLDAQGVRHFANAQFAPAGKGRAVVLHPTNGMDVPDTRILNRVPARKMMNIVKIDSRPKSNPRGWRGYRGRRDGASARGTGYIGR